MCYYELISRSLSSCERPSLRLLNRVQKSNLASSKKVFREAARSWPNWTTKIMYFLCWAPRPVCLSVWPYFRDLCWPLSVHLVEGLSAAGMEVESWGAAQFRQHLRVHAADCLAAGAAGGRRGLEPRGGRDRVHAAATLILDCHQKSPFHPPPPLNRSKKYYNARISRAKGVFVSKPHHVTLLSM